MDAAHLAKVADVAEPASFDPGAVVFREGDAADGLYVLESGRVTVSQKLPEAELREGDRPDKIIGLLEKGAYFGEMALLNDEPRSATIQADGACVCLRVDKRSFLSLLGPIRETLEARMPEALSPISPKRSLAPAPKRYAPDIHALAVVKPLGAGGFARVALARDPKTRRLYALKMIAKHRLLSQRPERRTRALKNEKEALEELSHPFVLSLAGSAQDARHCYLLFEACLGGELFGVMQEYGGMPERVAAFYGASVALALQHVHLLGYVYRDLKPENVLLDHLGFVKVCDFGFARKVADRAYTQCGTPDYVAPEMLLKQGVNFAADWWALGVLLYEMVNVSPPFSGPDGDYEETFANILESEPAYPSHFSKPLQKLVEGLLKKDVKDRLGYQRGGAEDVISDAFFGSVDFDALANATRDAGARRFGDATSASADVRGARLALGPPPESRSRTPRRCKPPWSPRLNAPDDASYRRPRGNVFEGSRRRRDGCRADVPRGRVARGRAAEIIEDGASAA